MGKVALIIIYNHQYNKNIDQLEVIYGKRFSHIFHLVPFYAGDKPNVIAVYDSSYFFQGYVAQGLKGFFEDSYEHYFFIGDDLILNPAINEDNYKAKMKLNAESCFIPRLSPINEAKVYWPNNITALMYARHSPGVEAIHQLPGEEEATKRLKKFGVENKPLQFFQIWQLPQGAMQWARKLVTSPKFVLRYLGAAVKQKKYSIVYPLVRSYADIFVVSAGSIQQFCHYCGVFAATRLFVELGLPTAMALSAGEIVTEKDIPLSGRALWTKEDHAILDQYNFSLQNLLERFPEGYLYLHPIKLSKWKN